jgi:hypothetical protein
LRRRIGRNGLVAIQVSLAYVEAQNEYASLDPAGLGLHVYAQRIVSRPGKKDGLYWPIAEGETLSPLGELAAKASAEGYKAGVRHLALRPHRQGAQHRAPSDLVGALAVLRGRRRGARPLLAELLELALDR